MPEINPITSSVEYREIPEIEGYRFGSDGTAWSRWIRGHSKLGDRWKLKATHLGKDGYVCLSINGRGRRGAVALHLLILRAFSGPCPAGMEARHLDGDRRNARLDNLAWGTHLENERDKDTHGTRPYGERHAGSKITEGDVRVIRRLRAEGLTLREIGERFGMSDANVSLIARRKRIWLHVD